MLACRDFFWREPSSSLICRRDGVSRTKRRPSGQHVSKKRPTQLLNKQGVKTHVDFDAGIFSFLRQPNICHNTNVFEIWRFSRLKYLSHARSRDQTQFDPCYVILFLSLNIRIRTHFTSSQHSKHTLYHLFRGLKCALGWWGLAKWRPLKELRSLTNFLIGRACEKLLLLVSAPSRGV